MPDYELTNEDIAQLALLGVTAVVLFGSRATGTAHANSDFDFGILLGTDGFRKRGENYHEYYTSVYDIFASRFGDLKGLDIVFLDKAPLELRRHVAKYGKILFETTAGQVANFNVQTQLQYADFEPYRLLMNQAVLDRI